MIYSIMTKFGFITSRNTGVEPGVGIELNLFKNNKAYSFGVNYGSEFQSSRKPVQGNMQFDLLYGKFRYSESKLVRTQYQVGIGIVKGVKRGEYLGSRGGWFFSRDYYEKVSFLTLGVPFKTGIVFIRQKK